MRRRAQCLLGIGALAALLLGSNPLWSQPPGPGGPPGGPAGPGTRPPVPPVLEALDADRDGEISAAEIDHAAAALRSLDKDQNGELSREEMGPIVFFSGPPRREEMKVLKQFDKDKDGLLNQEERVEARKHVRENRPAGPRGFGFGGFRRPQPGGPDGPGDRPDGPRPDRDAPPEGNPAERGPGDGGPEVRFFGPADQQGPAEIQPGIQLSPDDVPNYPDRDFYDPQVIRTLFFEFDTPDWEQELEDFHNTDVEVPAQLTVDGQTYANVGVRFRGTSSYMTVRRGQKRSLNVSIDLGDENQRLYGYKTLNLLNSHTDPSFLRAILFNQIARNYLPAPQANFVRVVINGENWGVYINEEQFNKDFVQKWFGEGDGVRWKVPPNFSGAAALAYQDDKPESYKSLYEISSKDKPEAWEDLMDLCRTLAQASDEDLELELEKRLNVDRALWFLALDNVLLDGDGYYSRGSDYLIYQDARDGRFHLLPRDSNETFRAPEGPGQPRTGGFTLDPLARTEDATRPLVKRLMANPKWRARYLAHVRTIVDEWLDWEKLGPIVEQYQHSIQEDVERDTRKLYSYEQFLNSASGDAPAETEDEQPRRGPFGPPPGLKRFVEERRAYLLAHPELNKPAPVLREAAHPTAVEGAVHVTARVEGELPIEEVRLYYATSRQGRFTPVPMFDDGQHQDGQASDGVYGATVKPVPGSSELLYYIEAQAAEPPGTMSFLPTNTELGASRYELPRSQVAQPAVVINELMAAKSRTVLNPRGKYSDWIELFNPGDQEVDLSGKYLSDSAKDPRKWKIPSGTRIAPRGYLIIWCDENKNAEEGLHANFKLSEEGERISLVEAHGDENRTIDAIEFDQQSAEVSFGRLPDAGIAVQPLVPTPGGANRAND